MLSARYFLLHSQMPCPTTSFILLGKAPGERFPPRNRLCSRDYFLVTFPCAWMPSNCRVHALLLQIFAYAGRSTPGRLKGNFVMILVLRWYGCHLQSSSGTRFRSKATAGMSSLLGRRNRHKRQALSNVCVCDRYRVNHSSQHKAAMLTLPLTCERFLTASDPSCDTAAQPQRSVRYASVSRISAPIFFCCTMLQ